MCNCENFGILRELTSNDLRSLYIPLISAIEVSLLFHIPRKYLRQSYIEVNNLYLQAVTCCTKVYT